MNTVDPKNLSPEQKRALLARLMEQKAANAALLHLRVGKHGASSGLIDGDKVPFADLTAAATRLARQFHQAELGPGKVAVVALVPSRELAVAILAVLQTGAAFLHLPPTTPPKFARLLLRKADACLLVGPPELEVLAQDLCGFTTTTVSEDGPEFRSEPTAQAPAMVVREGSALVLLSHAALSARLDALATALTLSSEDTLLFTTPETFLLGWTQGAAVTTDPTQATVIWSDPAHLEAFTHCRPRAVYCTGEALTQEAARAYVQQMDCALFYGTPYPAVAGPISVQAFAPDERELLSLETPVATTAFVLDNQLKPVPQGARGELYLGGPCLALGYLGVIPQGERRFLDSPFQTGERLFKTGDRARRMADGGLEISRPIDRQVLRGGVRIDLAQVEALLASLPGVVEAGALARRDTRMRLVAYLVVRANHDIQHHLEQVLPPRLLPDSVVLCNRLPRDSEGRLDSEALLRMETLDEGVAALVEDQLRSDREIHEAVALVRETVIPQAHIHLSDLIRGWSPLAPQEKSLAEASAASSNLDGKPAYVEGPELVLDPAQPATLAAALRHSALNHASKGVRIVVKRDQTHFISYAELYERASAYLAGLRAAGVGPGQTAVLQIRDLPDYFPVLWACILGGITPVSVAIAPSFSEENAIVTKLYNVWRLLHQPAVICSDALAEDLEKLPSIVPMEGVRVLPLARISGFPAGESDYEVQPNDLAFFQLSSGSTGISKCIQETHRGIICHIQASTQVVGYQASDVVLNWLSMDHVVPLLMYHIKDVYMGCDQVQVVTSAILDEPLLWLDLIAEHHVTHTWSPNFAYKLLADTLVKAANRTWDLSSIRYFLNAGEQVTLPVCREFLKLVAPFGVDQSAMQPAYGMAEVCTAMVYESPFSLVDSIHFIAKHSLSGNLEFTEPEAEGALSFVVQGPPIPGTAVRIVDKSGQLLSESVIGRVQIKNPSVSPGYLKNPEANAEAFIGEGWYHTGDLGYLRDGRLVITGREKELIIINGANFHCFDIEDLVYGIDGVLPTFVAACGIDDPDTGTEGLAIFFSPEEENMELTIEIMHAIRKKVTWNLGITPSYVVPITRERFPKTTSGKLQRMKMKQNLLEGEYSDILMTLDLAQKNENTMPDWFFAKRWHTDRHGFALAPAQLRKLLIFAPSDGSLDLAAFRDVPHTRIYPGSRFTFTEFGDYTLDPSESSHWDQLFASLGQTGFPERILFAGPSFGYAPILHLIQAIVKVRQDERPLLMVAGSQGQAVVPEDRPDPNQAVLSGLLKTAALEHPWLNVRYSDFDQLDGAALLRELSLPGAQVETAWRQGVRYLPVLEKVDLTYLASVDSPLRRGARCLIAGGLGGIGTALTRFLLSRFQANVLLLGRSQPTGKSSETLQELQRLQGQVTYAQADLTDRQAVASAVEAAESAWGQPVQLVFQLAGLFREVQIIEESPAQMDAAMAAKQLGSLNLDALLDSRSEAILVSFSSINAHFGGHQCAAYAAACAFQDRLFYASANRKRHYCLHWSMWDEIGMSAGYALKALTRANGYHILNTRQGMNALQAVLEREPANLLVGLDDGYPNIRAALPPCPTRELAVFVTTHGEQAPSAQLRRRKLSDRFGTTLRWSLQHVSALPRTASGQVDLARLLASTHAVSNASSYKEPGSETEKAIAQIWTEVLGLEKISVDSDFFELGGHSLMATRVIGRTAHRFKIDLNVRILFEATTIELLAERVDALRNTSADHHAEPIPVIERGPAGQPFHAPLSFSQQRLWFLHQLEGPSPTYNIHGVLELRGQLNSEALRQSLNQVIARHEALRTTFGQGPEGPYQIIAPSFELALPIITVEGVDEASRELEVTRRIKAHAGLCFDLASGPLLAAELLNLGEDHHLLLINQHHIVADGWSLGIWIRELGLLYPAYARGLAPDLAPLSLQFADFAAWQRQWLQGENLERQQRYWQRHLAELPPLLELPTDKKRPAVFSYAGHTAHFALPGPLVQDLEKLAAKQGATLFMVLLSAFKVLLHRYTGSDDIFVGSPIANRTRPELEPLIGFFMNNLVLRTAVFGDESFETLVAHVKRVTVDAYAHQDLPFEQLVELIEPERSLSHSPLFQVMFVLQNASSGRLELPGLSLSQRQLYGELARYDFNLLLDGGADGLNGMVEYSTDLFRETTVQRMMAHFRQLLEAIVAQPTQVIGRLHFLARDERRALLEEWNDTATALPYEQLLHQGFIQQAQQHPERVAVIADGDSLAQLTYGELHQRALAIGSALRQRGALPEQLVGMVISKGLDQIAAVLGVLYAGAAYLPIDPNWPQERQWQLLALGKAELVLVEARFADVQQWPDTVTALQVEQLVGGPVAALEPVQRPNQLAYVLFTSGSTGTPKGVAIEHRAALNTVLDLNQRYQITAQDRIFGLSALSFDLSVFDLFGPLNVGGALVLPHADYLLDPARWAQALDRHDVTLWNSVPALLQVLVESIQPHYVPAKLRLAVLSGDWIPVSLPAQIRRWWPELEIVSMGGATEASIWSIYFQIGEIDPDWPSIPYGYPLANQSFYVLDSFLEPCPPGVTGNLYIGGVGLARGYWEDPERSAAAFVNHRGRRLYKTGDLGRYLTLADGSVGPIQFLGRADFQVKLNGYRIELGEIEYVLLSHPSVAEAVVEIHGSGNDRALAAWLVCRNPVNDLELRQWVGGRLPEYMVPTSFHLLESLPLTANGKLDRKALPQPSFERSAQEIVAARTETEKQLVALCSVVLERETMGVNESFFDLGGNSLAGIRFITAVRNAMGVELSVRALFESPTIEALAIRLDAMIDGMRAQQEPLSDDLEEMEF